MNYLKIYKPIEIAWMHFYPEGNGQPLKGHVLHHKDPELKRKDPVRYSEWRIEDLELMTRQKHNKFHADYRWSKAENHLIMSNSAKLSHNKPEVIKKHSDVSKEVQNRPDIIKRKSEKMKQVYETTNLRQIRRDAMLGRHWYNNGIEQCFCKECPEGWIKGKLKGGESLRFLMTVQKIFKMQ